jgi:hypothetical protein
MLKSRWFFGPLLGLLTCWLTLPVASRADSVVFSNFGPNGRFDAFVGLVAPFGAAYSTTGVPGDVGVPFTPSSDADLSQIILALGWENGSPPDSTTVELVNSNNGVPGTSVLESWPATALPFDGPLVGPTTFTSSPGVFLAAGTQYWIVAQTDGVDF